MDHDVQALVDRYEMAVAIAQEFTEELGEERAHPIIQRALEKMQIKVAQELAAKLGGNSLEALANYYRQQAAERENLEILEITDKQVALKITRCRAFEAFSHLGAPEICRLYCDSDDVFIKSFNPDMKMIRTRTIAAGDDYCDHIWALEE
jgi:predicted ArsR family transcriptional regulator